jgi:hypothetical protein
VATINTGNATGTIAMGSGLTASDVYLQAGESGNLSIDIAGDPSDSIVVNGDLTYNGSVSSAISAITFADGSSIDLTQRPLTFTWFGASNNYNLSGNTWGTNIFDITQGNGSITFGKTAGVGGVNIVDYAKGAGVATINTGNATGTIAMGSGLTASDVLLQADSSGDLLVDIVGDPNDQIIVQNDLTYNGTVNSAIQQISFSDGTSINLTQNPITFTYAANSNNANLSGTNFGTNLFELGAGSEMASGGSGANFFQVSRDTGQAAINLSSATGSQNEIDFTGSITDQNLWFQQSGNNLQIDLLGTNTTATIDNWFSGSSSQLQEITAGGVKIDSQISQLVQAMATYSANNPGFDPASSGSTVPTDTSLQTAVAAAWHS